MKYNLLSHMKIKKADAGQHHDGIGLYLIKRRTDSGKWILRLYYSGKRRDMGLGRWPDVSLADARELADDARKLRRNGFDPIAERRKRRATAQVMTVKEAVQGCFEARKSQLKGDGKPGQWLSPLNNHVVPKIGNEPIGQLDQHQIKAVLDPIWHTKPDVARKALMRLRLSLKHAAAHGLDVDLQAPDKASALLGKQRSNVKHIPSMPYKDVPAFYGWLTGQSSLSALALRFLILTATRTSEVRMATFDEISDGIWILPPERTKNGREHRVPLADEVLDMVSTANQWSPNKYLFASQQGKPMSDMAMSKFMRTNGYDSRPHGFRSSFRVWTEEQTEADYAVKEACLGHHVDAGVVGAYQRSDRLEKRRELLDQWTKFVTA